MRRKAISARAHGGAAGALSILLALAACGSDEKTPPGSAPLGAGARVTGRVVFKMKMRLGGAQPDQIKPQEEAFKAQGITFAPDYSEAYFDSTPVGWPIKVGDALTFVDSDGTFTLTLPPNAPPEWTLYDPTEEARFTTVWGTGKVPDLVPEGQMPSAATEIPVRFAGGCGMNGPEDPAGDEAMCKEVAAVKPASFAPTLASSAAEARAEHAHAHGAQAGHACGHGDEHAHEPSHGAAIKTRLDLPPQRSQFPTGTERECLDYDGPVLTGTKRGTLRLVAYLGSTCQKFVVQGCCVNEGGTFAEFLEGAKGKGPDRQACSETHHGRQCQELALGHLELMPIAELEVVALGAKVPLNVHNNGCFGETVVTQNDRTPPIGGTLTGPDLQGVFLKHYDKSGPAGAYSGYRYYVDRVLTYEAPRCVSPDKLDKLDSWQFRVDGTLLNHTYKIERKNLWRYTSGASAGLVFSGDGVTIAPEEEGCPGQFHVHNVEPCTGNPVDPDPKGCGHGTVVPQE